MKKTVFKPSWIARLLRCSALEIVVHVDEVKIVTRHKTLLVDIEGLPSLGGDHRSFLQRLYDYGVQLWIQ